MKRILFLLGLLTVTTGCSGTKQTVNIVAEKWEVGQRQDCIYAHNSLTSEKSLYCVSPTLETFGMGLNMSDGAKEFFPALWDKQHPLPPEQIRATELFMVSFSAVRSFEKESPAEMQKSGASVATYDTRFSAVPVDYSIFDCLKTGDGGRPIDCRMLKKPEGKELDWIKKNQQDAAISDHIKHLTVESLKKSCGDPVDTSNTSISTTLRYAVPSGKPVEFEFNTYSSHELDTVLQPDSNKKSGNRFSDSTFWWYKASGNFSDAGKAVKTMPCLMK